MNLTEVNSRLVNFLIINTPKTTNHRFGYPITNMGDAWGLLECLGVDIERVIFYNKSGICFCGVQWTGDEGGTIFKEAWGETCQEALCRSVVKVLGGDEEVIIGRRLDGKKT